MDLFLHIMIFSNEVGKTHKVKNEETWPFHVIASPSVGKFMDMNPISGIKRKQQRRWFPIDDLDIFNWSR